MIEQALVRIAHITDISVAGNVAFGLEQRRVPRAVSMALGAIHQATEVKDFVDALFEALPKELQKSAPKSGKTMRGSRLPPGTPYTTTYDKARQLYRHWHEVDFDDAVKELLKNHLEDELVGRISGGSDDFSKKRLGGARFM